MGSRVYIRVIFFLQVHFKVSAVRYCSHYLPLVSLTMVANLPLVSTTPVVMVAKFAAGVIDTDVVDTGVAP